MVRETMKALYVSNVNDETPNNIPNEVSELLAPGTYFDRQPHTHFMLTGETAQTSQILEIPRRRILAPLIPPHQHRDLSTQVSQDNSLPMIEQTPRNQNSHANTSKNRIVDAVAGIATQQRAQAATMLKPVSTNTFSSMVNTKKNEFFEDLFNKMLKMQPEMTEAMKINHFYAHLRKEALNQLEI